LLKLFEIEFEIVAKIFVFSIFLYSFQKIGKKLMVATPKNRNLFNKTECETNAVSCKKKSIEVEDVR
jgi:hypothetical protein